MTTHSNTPVAQSPSGLVIAGLMVGSSVLILAERGTEGSTILRIVGV
jgi:hypothetical protein